MAELYPPALMDEVWIKSLLVRERYYRDSYQWQKLRDCYHPDASRTLINISWFRGDIDGFVSGSEDMAKRGASASHTITPIEVEFNGNKALALCTGNISARFEKEGALYDCISWTRFIYRLERTTLGWKILNLEVIYERDSIIPVIPGPPPRTPIELKCSRQSYSCLAWVLSQKGYEINEHLAGLDWPESVEKFMVEQYRWLNE